MKKQNRSTVPSGRGRRALLIDLDNVLLQSGQWVQRDEAIRRLRAIRERAGGVHHTLEVAPHRSVRRWASELAAADIAWAEVSPGPDSADHTISLIADELVAHGYTELCIASGDHYFAPLAEHARLVVIDPGGCALSHELYRAASEVYSLAA